MKKLGLLLVVMLTANFASAQTLDTLTYPADRASGFSVFAAPGDSGFIAGTNSIHFPQGVFGTLQVGNNYDFGKGKVLGAFVWFAGKTQVGAADQYEVRVYDTGADSLPTGAPLDQVSFTTADVDTPQALASFDTINYFDFPNDPQQTGRFFISVQTDGPNQNDTLGIVTNSSGDGLNEERAGFQLSNGTWLKLDDLWGSQQGSINVDLVIFPVVEREFFASASANKSEACPGETVDLTANVSGGSGNYQFQWMPGGSTPNSQSTTVQLGNQLLNTTRTFDVIVTDVDNQVSDTGSVSVDVRGIDVSISPGDTSIACGDSINLFASAQGYTQGVSFDWSNGVTGASNNNVADGTFSITVTNSLNCSSNASTEVSIQNVTQTLNFEVPDTICENRSVSFTNNSKFTNGWNFTWDFGGGSMSSAVNPTFTFTNPGNKTVTLSGDSAGCTISPVQKSFNVQDSSTCPFYTGIADREKLEGQVSMYPNPTSGKLLVSMSNIEHEGNLTLEIINIQGQKVYSKNLGQVSGQLNKELDMSDYTNGIYLIKLQGGDKVATDKVTLSR